MLRKVLITVVGHVDHGKTTLLDTIRASTVANAEAGAITQAIGVSIIPIETIKQICGSLLDVFKDNLKVPGLLAIDTPGHAAFTSLRKRGGSLADIAILVVDINEGFKPQTIESIEILKKNKVPFIIAANKVDLIHGWNFDETKGLLANINALDSYSQQMFETKLYEVVGQVHEHAGMNADRFDRVQDYTNQIAIVPVSAKKGQGIPELLMVMTGLAQKFLEKRLEVTIEGDAQGTVLEVKEVKGLGTTLDCIIYQGQVSVNDNLIIGGLDKPVVTKVRALLEPDQNQEMRVKGKFHNVQNVQAATGVKIVAPNLDGVIAGMPLRSSVDSVDKYHDEIVNEVGEVLNMDNAEHGVIIKADTIGGLEALRNLLDERDIPVAAASIGTVSKRDLALVESMKEVNEEYAVLLGFNIETPSDVASIAKNKGLSVYTDPVIYSIIDKYEAYVEDYKKRLEQLQLSDVQRPFKIHFMPNFVFRQSNPAIGGFDILKGNINIGARVMNPQGERLGTIKSIKDGKDNVNKAEQGAQVPIAIDGPTIGRQLNEDDILYSDINEPDFIKMKEHKHLLTSEEKEVLREIAVIKRNSNPVWGI